MFVRGFCGFAGFYGGDCLEVFSGRVLAAYGRVPTARGSGSHIVARRRLESLVMLSLVAFECTRFGVDCVCVGDQGRNTETIAGRAWLRLQFCSLAEFGIARFCWWVGHFDGVGPEEGWGGCHF